MFNLSLTGKLTDTLNRNLLDNYFVAAFRSLTRDKINLALSLLGLAVGLSASFLIALYAQHESSYDVFQPNVKQTYRLVMHAENGNEYALTTPQALQELKKIEGIEDIGYFLNGNWFSDNKIRIGNQFFKLQQSYRATENISDFVSLDILQGDLHAALTQPEKIALASSEALRLFGTLKAVGKTFISQGDNKKWTVSAVFSDIPENSHFAFKSLATALPFKSIRGNIAQYYLRMSSNANLKLAEDRATQVIADIWNWNNISYKFQPLLDIHLAKNYSTDMKVGGSQRNVFISIGLCVLLLIISSFNTINMSIAQAGSRAKEVGVRKVLGASKLQLIIQFLTESVVLTLISVLIAGVIVELFLPNFNQLVGRELSIGNWSAYIIPILVVTLLVGIASGLYPALFISAFSIKRVLAGDFQQGKSAAVIRKTLMTIQLAFAVALIIAATNLGLQLNLLQNLSVNYESHQRLAIKDAPRDQIFSEDSQALYQALTKIEGVISATPSDFSLTDRSNAGFFIESISGQAAVDVDLAHGGVGFNAVQTFGLQLVAGRDFSTQFPSDWYHEENSSSAIIIPESILSQVGYKNAEQAIGKVWMYSAGGTQHVKGTIVGVIKDVKIGSVRTESIPLVLVCGLPIGVYSIIVEVTDQESAIIKNAIAHLLGKRLNMSPVEIQSVAINYQALYQTDNQLTQMVIIFSALAIFLSCVGMFGLAALNAQRRNREIAIRKVIGASRLSLVGLLARESLNLVGLSMVIAFPIAYLFIDNWLNHFNERISQSVSIYLGAALIVAIITWLTISVIAFRSASKKPSDVLRSE